MNKSAILGNAILWAAVILASAILLKGTPQAGWMVVLLSSAATMSTLLLGASCRRACHRSRA